MDYRLLSVNNGPEQNIGDYIQALASSQFFPHIDGFLNREELNSYNGKECAVIMNGWFMHNPLNWPPSDLIKPLFIAFHLNSSVEKALLSPEGIKYLKNHVPIGCRDQRTCRLLMQNGVEAYFSGCMTLTLGLKYKNNERGNTIFFVDPFYRINKDMISLFRYTAYIIFNYRDVCFYKERVGHKHHSKIHQLFEAAAFYCTYKKLFAKKVLKNAEYIRQQSPIYTERFLNDEERLKEAERLVICYSKARYVVTSRIHCALPCLGVETPVVFTEDALQPGISACRFEGLRELFNVLRFDKNGVVSEFGISWFDENTSFLNKPNWKKLSDSLIMSCQSFVAKFES